jgi:hypothetical protein
MTRPWHWLSVLRHASARHPLRHDYAHPPPIGAPHQVRICVERMRRDGLLQWRGPAALQELNHEDDHRKDEQEMDEASQGIGGHQTEEPQHEQDHKDRPQHRRLLLSMSTGGSRADANVSQVRNTKVGEQDRQCKFFHDFPHTCCFVVSAGTEPPGNPWCGGLRRRRRSMALPREQRG